MTILEPASDRDLPREPSPLGARPRIVSARKPWSQRVGDLWRYRELLLSLVRKELKVKYKNSVLGFMWSLLNPALYLVVFSLVFQVFLGNGIPRFAILLLSGLLVWNLFATAVSGGCASMVTNAGLVNKISFPREILPLASVGASLFHFFLQGIVLVIAVTALRHGVAPGYMLLLPLALLVLVIFTSGVAILLSAINVYARDTQHLLELVLLAWFWMTPIVYSFETVVAKVRDHSYVRLLYLNPMIPIVLVFQRAIYNTTSFFTPGPNGTKVENLLLPDQSIGWYLIRLGIVGVASILVFFGSIAVFGRLEGNFAEEL